MQNNLQLAHAVNHTKTKQGDIISGEYFELGDSVNGDVKHLEIYGKTLQTVTVQGKNLFNYNELVETANLTKVAGSNAFRVTGVYAYYQTTKLLATRLLPNTTYKASGIMTLVSGAGGGSYGQIRYYNGSTSITLLNGGVSGSFSTTFTTPSDVSGFQYFYTYGSPTTTDVIEFRNIQIELGSTATAYASFVPNSPSPQYPASTSSTNNFDVISTDGVRTDTHNFLYSLRSLPDGTCDKIVIDDVAKTAVFTKNINSIVYNGTESWGLSINSGDQNRYYLIGVGMKWTNGTPITPLICSHLKAYPTSYLFTNFVDGIMGYNADGRIYVNTKSSVSNSLASFKAWLAANNMTVQYAMATPVVTNLSYAAVKQYYPETNLYTNAVIKPTLSGSFLVLGH